MLGYFQTLSDAERYPPVRLGGETMIQTALTTLHCVIPYSATTANASIIVHPRLWAPVLVSETPGATGGYNQASYVYRTLGGWPSATRTTLAGLAAAARVVSMKVKVYSTSSATSDNGSLTIGLCPKDPYFLNNVEVGGFTPSAPAAGSSATPGRTSSGGFPIKGSDDATQGYVEFASEDWSDTVPLKMGASCFWLPEDPSSMIFDSARLRQEAVFVPNSSGTGQVPPNLNPENGSILTNNQILDPFVAIGLSGMTPNGGSGGLPGSNLSIEVFLNLEYTVTSGASNVIETVAGAMNSVQAFDVVKKVGANLQNTVVPDPEGSLWDKAKHLGTALVKGGINGASKFLFGSSDVGNAVSDLIF